MNEREVPELRYLRQSILLAVATVAGVFLPLVLLFLGLEGPSCQPSNPIDNQTTSSCPGIAYYWGFLVVWVTWIASCLVGLVVVRRSYRRYLKGTRTAP